MKQTTANRSYNAVGGVASELEIGKDENAAIELCTANIYESEVQDTENC